MKEEKNNKLENIKQKGIDYIQSISINHLQQIMALHSPPQRMQRVGLLCLKLQSGVNCQIKVDQYFNPQLNTWKGCVIMISCNSHHFKQTCIQIFDQIGKNQYLDKHIIEVQQIIAGSAEYDPNQIAKASLCFKKILLWIYAVIQYYRMLRQQN